MDSEKPIRLMAVIGLVLKILHTVLVCAVYLAPQFVLGFLEKLNGYPLNDLSAIRHPLNFVMPLVSLAVFVLFYYLLNTQLKKRTGNAAVTTISCGAFFLIVSPILSAVFNTIKMVYLSHMNGAEAIAALGTVSTAINYIGIATGAAVPALLIAYALHWYRQRYLPQ
ncbi:MAG: hypothetical protein IK107_00010 [Oscillospiraceae bacterium]|nr:hypothetical protein [Oscillospiraceae bacterium]